MLVKSLILILVLPAFSFAADEPVVEGDLSISILREDERLPEFQTVVGIYLEGQSTFGKPDEKNLNGDRAKYPRFFKVDSTAKKQTLDLRLPEGDYRAETILKKSMNGCDVGGTKTNASCLPLIEDRYCAGEGFVVSRRKTAFVNTECKAGK